MSMNKLPIKTFMIIYLSALLVLSGLWLGQIERIWLGILVVAIACAFDLLWTYHQKKKWFVPSSAIISGLIIALVFDTALHPILALCAGLLAAMSKHFLRFGRRRHLINPAACAMVILSLFAPVAAWWGVGWGTAPLTAVIAAGAYILYRLRSFSMVVAFLVSYLVILLAATGAQSGFGTIPSLASALILDGTLLFFASVMLIEPITASFPLPKQRIFFGVFVGALAALISLMPRFWPLRTMDPLLLALVVGNIVMGLRTLPVATQKMFEKSAP